MSATPTEARVLGVRRGAPLVSIVRTASDADGRPFERSHDLFRGDRVRIVVKTRPSAQAASPGGSVVEIVSAVR